MSVEDPHLRPVLAPNLADDPYVALGALPGPSRPIGYRLRFALHAAVLAPSVHNTQPWRFRIHESSPAGSSASDSPAPYVDLLMDTTRELPALDPAHRQLVMSCGAALGAYEIGLRSVGLEPQVELLPAGAEPACVARIRVADLGVGDGVARALLPALVARRSYRGAMDDRPVPAALQAALASSASGQTLLDFVPWTAWRAVEHLVVTAALALSESTEADAETRTWTRLNERSRDGVPAVNWQRSSEQTAGAPVVQRDFAQGRPLPEGPGGHPHVATIEGDPLMAVLLTPADTSLDWLEAGRALLRMALTAQSAGLALGYLNQPTEVPGLREKLAAELQPIPSGYAVPQLLLRLGYPAEPLPPLTPRRPPGMVLLTG